MNTITMTTERRDGTLERHGFHLGTNLEVARPFAVERYNRGDARSVALWQGGQIVDCYALGEWERAASSAAFGDAREDGR